MKIRYNSPTILLSTFGTYADKIISELDARIKFDDALEIGYGYDAYIMIADSTADFSEIRKFIDEKILFDGRFCVLIMLSDNKQFNYETCLQLGIKTFVLESHPIEEQIQFCSMFLYCVMEPDCHVSMYDYFNLEDKNKISTIDFILDASKEKWKAKKVEQKIQSFVLIMRLKEDISLADYEENIKLFNEDNIRMHCVTGIFSELEKNEFDLFWESK